MDRKRRAALIIVAASLGIGVAAAQVGGGSGLGTRLGVGGGSAGSDGSDGAGSGSAPRPAGASQVESNDVPEWAPGPARFAVAPFENHTTIRALDWITAGAPFEIAEKTEAVLGLEPTGGVLHVAAEPIPAEPGTVAAFAAARSATWVITGWFDRPNWELRLVIVLWKIDAAGRATIVAESQQTGPPATYHKLVGQALGAVWGKAGIPIDVARGTRLARHLAVDVYAVNLMGRGLGHLATARGTIVPEGLGSAAAAPVLAARTASLKAAEHDLERAVFIDPKLYEAQRLLGELYLTLAPGDARAASRAAGKFNYAHDLAPDDIGALRAAAGATAAAGKHELAVELYRKLVTIRPWDLDARYELGAAWWRTGRATLAERQLVQVITREPDHLPARRIRALVHASRSDTAQLILELEAIATRAPSDLEVKADLATAYGALGRWDRAAAALEAIATVRPNDLALLVRIGDTHEQVGDLSGALAWFARAGKLAPDSSLPGFATAQALFDAGKLADASRVYNSLQKYRDDLPATEQALGMIALLQNRADDAAWYLRRATRGAPRVLPAWQALIAAELARKDSPTALKVVERARTVWPDDAELRYLAGVAHAMAGDRGAAREALSQALVAAPTHAAARAALGVLDAGGGVTLVVTPRLVRPWGDATAYQRALDEFAQLAMAMAVTRLTYQTQLLTIVGELGQGPLARGKPGTVRACPLSRIAQPWSQAQQALRRYERLGVELEATYRYIVRHDDSGATAGLLPNARTQVATSKRAFRVTLADVGELRAEWVRGLGPELRAVGCADRLLAAAVADPQRYHVIEEDRPEAIPTQTPPRTRPRATFYVDNTSCPDVAEVWIDGSHLGQVAPGRRSALVADGGERTLCLIVSGAAQCGDRGTVRQVYLHDGWSVKLHCPK